MTKTKIALAAALIAVTGSAALAQGASIRAQQYRNIYSQSGPALQQRNVALPNEGRFSTGPFWYNGSGPTSGGM